MEQDKEINNQQNNQQEKAKFDPVALQYQLKVLEVKLDQILRLLGWVEYMVEKGCVPREKLSEIMALHYSQRKADATPSLDREHI